MFNIDENDKKLENRLRESFDLVLFNVPKNVDRFDISSIFLNKIHIRPRMIRLVWYLEWKDILLKVNFYRIIGHSNDTNIILIQLDDNDKHSCDFVINEFNRIKVNFENVKKRNVDLLIKKIELNCCNHDIIIKICNIKNLDEFFVEKIKIDCVASLKPENNDIKPQVENNENLALEIEKLKK